MQVFGFFHPPLRGFSVRVSGFFVKCIPKYLLDAVVNGIVSLISCLDCPRLVVEIQLIFVY